MFTCMLAAVAVAPMSLRVAPRTFATMARAQPLRSFVRGIKATSLPTEDSKAFYALGAYAACAHTAIVAL